VYSIKHDYGVFSFRNYFVYSQHKFSEIISNILNYSCSLCTAPKLWN